MTLRIALVLAVLSALSCKSAPAQKPVSAPTVENQELAVAQELSAFKATFTGTVKSATAIHVNKAHWELVVDGNVVQSGDSPIGLDVPAGGSAPFKVEAKGSYIRTADELKAMTEKGGSLLTALRGTLSSTGAPDAEFAKSKEVRVPRLPKVKMNDAEGARYSDEEVNLDFYLGVENPNPFDLPITSIDYTATVAGKQLSDGHIGGGEKVSPASTGVFEVQIAFTKENYGPDVKNKVKTGSLPYELKGTLHGDLFEIPFELKGDLKLNKSTK